MKQAQGNIAARLQARGKFALRVLRQRLDKPTRDEAIALGIKCNVLVRTREVALYCDGKPVVFAHTILPRHPRGPVTGWLARLGNRSLGAMLFDHPGFSRSQIRSKRLDCRHPLFEPAIAALQLTGPQPRALWARRSRFGFGRQSILVTEVFSPALCSR